MLGQPEVGAARTVTPPVFMYHSISPSVQPDPHRLRVHPDRLDRHLRLLSRLGLRGVSLGELLRAREQGRAKGLVGLTFDDGYADFVEHALPRLRRWGCGATLFVLPGRLGGDNAWDPLGPRKRLLTSEGIRRAAAEGVEIGSHGLVHADLTTAGATTLASETAGSRVLLTELTGTAPAGFCYPYGAVDRRAADAVREAGYAYACAIDPGPLTGPYALPRVHVGQRDTAVRLLLKTRLHRLRRRPAQGV